MNILQRISAIALCLGVLYVDRGLGQSCELAWDNGTSLSSEWNWGIVLDTIEDTATPGTVLLNLTASSISAILSVTNDSASGQLFMQPNLTGNVFTVSLTDSFTVYEELETSTTMKITVAFTCASDTRSLEIYQIITDTNNHYPEFQNAPYSYTLPIPFPANFPIQLLGDSIAARDIDLTNTNVTFRLNYTDPNAGVFDISWLSQDTTDTKLHYAQLLSTALLNIESSMTFSIYATDNGNPTLTSETTVTIEVDEENSIPVSPIFTYPVYIADHSSLTADEANGTLIKFSQGNVSFSQGADATIVYTLTDNIGDYSDHFDVSVSSDYNEVALTLSNVSDEFLAESFVILTLSAVKPGASDVGNTVLHISLPGLVCAACDTESTTGWTTDGTTISWSDSTDWTTETTETTTCPICETATECPTVMPEECPTTVMPEECPTTVMPTECPTTDMPTECPTTSNDECECDCFTTASTDTTTDYVTDSTTTECPVVTVTEECICDDTTTSATVNTTVSDSETSTTVAPSLEFPKSIYRFEMDPTFTGVLMTETATATNANGTITYGTVIDDEHLNERVLIDSETAVLRITAHVDPGVYTFQITATISDLDLSTSAIVVLVVSSVTECNGEIVFDYALQVIELEEESAHENVVILDRNGCTYSIYSQTPDQDWFYVSDNTINSVAIDRESPYFSEMSVAQVRVTIDMTCPNDTTSRSRRDTEYEVITGNIEFRRTRMIVTAIIIDINDNAPEFSSDTPTVIGYPGYDLAQLIHVSYVYNFSATDADIGDNAIVTYSLDSSSGELFYISPATGMLYVTKGAYATDGYHFAVRASDSVFITGTAVTVRTLKSDNVAVYYLAGAVLDDLDDILKKLSDVTGYSIKSLNAAVISGSEVPSSSDSTRTLKSVSRRTKRASDVNTLLRIVLYGIYNNEPVSNEALIDSADEVEGEWEITEKTTLDALLAISTITEEVSTLRYWIVIIVLAVVLVIVLICTIYCVCTRSKKVTPDETDRVNADFEKTNGNGVQRAPSARKETITLNGASEHTGTSTTEPRRKSVAFKDSVEEIEVARL